jgi:hypothetical protein
MFCQNDQIHNILYLTVENSIEIGKGYQVIEKWVFFKLLFQSYKQTHLGVRITGSFIFCCRKKLCGNNVEHL